MWTEGLGLSFITTLLYEKNKSFLTCMYIHFRKETAMIAFTEVYISGSLIANSSNKNIIIMNTSEVILCEKY